MRIPLLIFLLSLGGQIDAVAQFSAPTTVELDTALSATGVHPGGQVVLAVVMDVIAPFHVNANDPGDSTLIPTSLEILERPAGLKFGAIQYPAGHPKKFDFTEGPVNIYEGMTVLYLPISVSNETSPGVKKVKISLKWQACDDKVCYMPKTEHREVELQVFAPSAVVKTTEADLFKKFDPATFAAAGEPDKVGALPKTEKVQFDFVFFQFDLSAGGLGNAVLILLLALVAGMLLNFTPCVLPVVPIKIMAFQQQAGSPAHCFALGVSFSVGIVASFGVLGLLAAGLVTGIEQLQWGQQFSSGWFTLLLGLIVGAMGLGMIGFFTTNLPSFVYRYTPSHDTHSGSFMFGVLTAVLSTPCTGPLFAGTMVWALKQPPWLGLTTFLTLGAGMALPYLVLTAKPEWAQKMPKTGPGSDLVKQVMGILLIAVAVYFLGIAGKAWWGHNYWYAVAFIVTGGMGWMIICSLGITKRLGVRAIVTVIGLLIAVSGWYATASLTRIGPIEWIPYQKQSFEEAVKSGKTVVLEFTADWCLNCKTLEIAVLHDRDIIKRLSKNDVVPMRVDLTSQSNTLGWQKLRALGSTGIPLTAIFHPGSDQPTLLSSIYTVEVLLQAIEKPKT